MYGLKTEKPGLTIMIMPTKPKATRSHCLTLITSRSITADIAKVTSGPVPDIADISANGRCLKAMIYTPTSANSNNARVT